MTVTTPNATNSPVVSMEDDNPVVDSPVTERNAQTNADSSPIVVTETPHDGDPDATTSTNSDTNSLTGENNEPSKNPTTPEWLQRRLDKVVAQRHDAEERARQNEQLARQTAEQNAELLRQIAELRSGGTTTNTQNTTQQPNANTQPTTQNLTEQQIEKLAMEKAAQLAEIARFNENCNRVADAGKKEFKDWDSALTNLRHAGVLGDGAAVEFLETAIELEQPHKVLHHLGTHPEEAERISKLPPKKMALELGRIETTLKNAKAPTIPVSRAPDPVIPVGGKATPPAPDFNDPNLPTEDWFAIRQQQIEDRRNRYRR